MKTSRSGNSYLPGSNRKASLRTTFWTTLVISTFHLRTITQNWSVICASSYSPFGSELLTFPNKSSNSHKHPLTKTNQDLFKASFVVALWNEIAQTPPPNESVYFSVVTLLKTSVYHNLPKFTTCFMDKVAYDVVAIFKLSAECPHAQTLTILPHQSSSKEIVIYRSSSLNS